MSQLFSPQDHLIELPRKAKNKDTGQWETTYDHYLEVKWRLVWFREKYPHGSIGTEFLQLDWEQGIAICKCIVHDGEGGCAHGTGTETRKGFEDFVEKSETRAIGRALAALGIGTQFVGEELSEGDHIADAPVSTGKAPAKSVSTPPAPTNGHTPAPKDTARMTPEAIDTLFHLALERCSEDKEVFGTRVKRALGLSMETQISKKAVLAQMTPDQYRPVYDYYVNLLAQLQRSAKETTRANASQDASAPTATAASPAESLPVDPIHADETEAGPSSASAPDPDDTVERERIVKEAVDAGLPEKECRHIVAHHDLKAAENLLLAAAKKRLQAAAA